MSIRAKGDKIGMWLGDSNAGESILTVGKKFKERLNIDPQVRFFFHQSLTHWGETFDLNFQALLYRVAFFESLKHTKQDFSIIEFKNQVSNLLRNLLILIWELILILGSKIHNFWTIFLQSHQNFAQNSTRNSKILVLKILVKKWQKIAQFKALK